MHILITEDEKDLADAIAKGLRQQGYAADVALDGEGVVEETKRQALMDRVLKSTKSRRALS